MPEISRALGLTCRRLWRDRGFTAVAAVTLALGIGANTAVFSVVDPLLVQKLPVREPDQLVLLHSTGTLQSVDISERSAFAQYTADHGILSEVTADAGLDEFQTMYHGRRGLAHGEVVASNFFSLLRVEPRLGRLLVAEDDAQKRPVIVLGFGYWTTVFGADPSIVGQTLALDGLPHTIVGVAPRRFFGMTVGTEPNLYVPFASGLRNPRWVKVVARLPPGVSAAQATVALDPLFHQIVATSTLPAVERQQDMARLLVTPVSRGLSDLGNRFGSMAWALGAVVGLVLLVAVANVANLVFTRAVARRHEVAIQLALGATRARLVQQFVLETAGVATIGAMAGLVSGFWVRRALIGWLSAHGTNVTLSRAGDVRVLLLSAAAGLLAIALCGVIPALLSVRIDVSQGLKCRQLGGRRSRLGQMLVVAQIGACVTLIVGAGLLIHSLINLRAFHVGFDPDRVLAVSLTDAMSSRSAGMSDAVVRTLLAQTRQFPGVEAAAVGALTPFTPNMVGINVLVDGNVSTSNASTHVLFSSVTEGYFETIGIPVAAGRGCASSDSTTSPPVVIINQRLAQHLLGRTDPLGQRLRFVEGRRPPMAIVGVVANTTYNNVREEPQEFLYLCRQRTQHASIRGVLFVRSIGTRADLLAPVVQRLVRSVDPGIEIESAETLGGYLAESQSSDRILTGLFSGFTILALMIAAVGLYGILVGLVVGKTREIGVRIALGADASRIARFVAAPAIRLTVYGFLVGSVGAFLSSTLLASLLFGVHSRDPLPYLSAMVVLAATIMLACYVPARRAIRIDPVAALRSE
jgi:putative ABC transport system permease protein